MIPIVDKLKLSSHQRELFDSLSDEVKQLLLVSEQKITKIVLDLFMVSEPSKGTQKFIVVILKDVEKVDEYVERIHDLARRSLLPKFFKFAVTSKIAQPDINRARDIVNLFYYTSLLVGKSFQNLSILPYERGGCEQLKKLKSESASSRPNATIPDLYKAAIANLFSVDSSFFDKETSVVNYLRSFSDDNRLPIPLYQEFFSKLRKVASEHLSVCEKDELIKTLFKVTVSDEKKPFHNLTGDHLDELIASSILVKAHLGKEGFFLIFHSPSITKEIGLLKILRLMKLIVSRGDEIAFYQELIQFSNGSLTISELMDVLEQPQVKAATPYDIHDDLDTRLKRFKEDKEITFALDESKLKNIAQLYSRYLEYCKGMENLSLDDLVVKGESIREKALFATLDEERWQLLAIGSLVMYRQFGIVLQSTQILATLALLTYGKNCVAQVKTGQRKTFIAGLMTFYLAMQHRSVDLITCSSYLATRDWRLFRDLFKRFGIITSPICGSKQNPSQFCAHVLYGTVYDYEFAYMNDLMEGKGLFAERLKLAKANFDCVIVDEVDNMIIDTSSNSARLAFPSDQSYHWIYSSILSYVKLFIFDNTFLLFLNAHVEALRSYLESKVEHKYHHLLNKITPDQFKIWLKSGYAALYEQKENIHYVIKRREEKNGASNLAIQIVDAEHTGRIMESSRWSNGIHEFLEVKHDIDVEKESYTPISLSHANFYRFYKNIFGLSGTLGSAIERKEMKVLYETESFDVPPHQPSLREDAPPKIFRSEKEYFDAICNSVKQCQNRNQPILVLCRTIKDSVEMEKELTKQGITCQILNEMQQDSESSIIEKAGFPRTVTIATNMASRGTDIKLIGRALECGLHTLIAYYTKYIRVLYQMLGRSGRGGQPGTTEIILCLLRDDLSKYAHTNLSDECILTALKTEAEQDELKEQKKRMLHCRLERIIHCYTERFFRNYRNWCIKIDNEGFLDYHSKRLSTLRITKELSDKVEHLTQEQRLILKECEALLRTPHAQKVDFIQWKTVLKKLVDLVKRSTISQWSINFYHHVQSDAGLFMEDSTDEKYREQIETIYNNQKDSWEKYLQENGQGVFVLLQDILGINLAERPKKILRKYDY